MWSWWPSSRPFTRAGTLVLGATLMVTACGPGDHDDHDDGDQGAPTTVTGPSNPDTPGTDTPGTDPSTTAEPGQDPASAVVRLRLRRCNGMAIDRATGVRIQADLVATVAHPFLDDLGRLDVSAFSLFAADATELEARLVYLDGERDVALLSTAIDAAPSLPLGQWDDRAITHLIGFATADAEPAARPVTVTRLVSGTVGGVGQRGLLELDGRIEAGDSGAPIVNQHGHTVGLVFAGDRNDAGGWAIAATEFDPAVSVPGEPMTLQCPTSAEAAPTEEALARNG